MHYQSAANKVNPRGNSKPVTLWFEEAIDRYTKGNLKAARSLASRAFKKNPDDANVEFLYGLCAEKDGNSTAAIKHYQNAIAIGAESFVYKKQLADLYQRLASFASAEKIYLELKAEQPDNKKMLENMALNWAGMGKHLNSFLLYKEMYDLGILDKKNQPKMAAMLAQVKESELSESLEAALLTTLSFDNVCHILLSQPISRYLTKKFAGLTEFNQKAFESLVLDPLFNAALSRLVLVGVALEKITQKARELILCQALSGQTLSPVYTAFAANIARQAELKEYVLFVGDTEQQLLKQLEDLLAIQALKPAWSPVDSELILLCLSMYTRLSSLKCSDKFSAVVLEKWPNLLQSIVKSTIFDVEDEIALAAKVSSLTPIKDGVSSSVQGQYEESPYPRWASVNHHAPLTPRSFLKAQFPWIEAPESFTNSSIDVLVAGCGTGRQPVEMAMMLPGSRIFAIDLSRRSLAYAKRKAKEFGLKNIEFHHADILNLGELNKTFDLIVSTGVIHHMAEPNAGWAVLRDLLRDDGLLHLALYSAVAREEVRKQREFISKLKLEPSAENIRKYRQAMMDREPNNKLYKYHDFWTMSECRDLLFHVQEHQYTWLGIKQACDTLAMKFRGVQAPAKIMNRFSKQFADNDSKMDLTCWHAFELNNPAAFSGMYSFLCSKAQA
ncbi:Methyltransferase domain-containing protein [Alteromonadaceae bacterium Bs31]|nr:Methyltransferase domain-containing protein [Alteromonadaceae bacterium Bs31]